MTGLTQHAFVMLLDNVFDLEEIAQCLACRRPWLLSSEGCLGLLLFYLGSTMNYKHLCLIFWHHSVCLQQFGKLDAEKSCAVIEGSSICKDAIS
jgi:hypothetical protein